MVNAGLEREIFAPADVTRHIPPGEWVKDVPLEVVAKMIASGLTRPQFDPRLALEHLTPQVIGEFVAPSLSWGLIDEGAVRSFELSAAKHSTPRPSIRPPSLPAAAPALPLAAAGGEPQPEAQPEAQPGFQAESVDSWVDSGDMVDNVESTSSGN